MVVCPEVNALCQENKYIKLTNEIKIYVIYENYSILLVGLGTQLESEQCDMKLRGGDNLVR